MEGREGAGGLEGAGRGRGGGRGGAGLPPSIGGVSEPGGREVEFSKSRMRCTFSRYTHGTKRMQHSGAAGSDALHTARQKMYQMRDERRTNG